MISQGDITSRTEWEISTVLTDPSSSRSSSVIEHEDFLSSLFRFYEKLYELMRYQCPMQERCPKWNESDGG
jgi:hypothetical protein